MLTKLLSILSLLSLSISAETIQHNGFTYKTVISPHTERVWLDRNIGASRVCKRSRDKQCYGNLFQWGRDADGHEKRNAPVTEHQARHIHDVGNRYILAEDNKKYDWAHNIDSDGQKRENNWERLDGLSVCPQGFRVPDIEEFEDETIKGGGVHDKRSAFKNFLKLPSSGFHFSNADSFGEVGSKGYYWSSSSNSKYKSWCIYFKKAAYSARYYRSVGMAVRCIRD